MFNRFTLSVGRRYAISRRGSHLVSFISRVSVVGLIISVALLILVMSIMNGFDRELRERILQVLPQGTIYNRQGIAHPSNIIARIEQNPEVSAAAPFVKLQGLLAHGKAVAPAGVFGVVPKLERRASSVEQYLQKGALNELEHNKRAVIVGRVLAKKLHAAIGDHLTLIIPRGTGGRASPQVSVLTIVDVLDTGTEIDNNLALMNLSSASGLSGYPGRVSGIHLQLKNLFKAPQAVSDIVAKLPPGFYGTDWTRTQGNLYHAIHMSKRLVGLLLLLLMGIAAFNLVSTLIMVVVDKHADIAILRTQGASSGDIVGIFLVQGGIIGLLGTFIGVLLGVVLALSVTAVVAWFERVTGIQFLHSDVYPVSYLPAELLWSDVAYIVLSALSLSFIASIYPAWRAARVMPTEALRYE